MRRLGLDAEVILGHEYYTLVLRPRRVLRNRPRKEVSRVSKKEELEELLQSLGAVFVRHGKDEVWRIGSKIVTIGHAITQDRQFQNYRAKILRVAREEGLLAPRTGEKDTSPSARERDDARPASTSTNTRRVAPATPDEVVAWNIGEEMRWRNAYRGGETVEKPKRIVMQLEDRIPFVDRVLREAGRPLTRTEISAELGWGASGKTAIGRIIKSYPTRYRGTRDQKRNERYELVPPPSPAERTAAVSIDTAVKEALPASAELLRLKLELAEARATAMGIRIVLERIRAVVEEAKSTASDPHRALFALGEIAGIIGEPTSETPPTEPAA